MTEKKGRAFGPPFLVRHGCHLVLSRVSWVRHDPDPPSHALAEESCRITHVASAPGLVDGNRRRCRGGNRAFGDKAGGKAVT